MIAQRRSLRGFLVRLSILCCLLVLTFSLRSAGVAYDNAGASDLIILRSQIAVDNEMVQLDPQTLADESSTPETGIDPTIQPWSVIFSRDGQTLAGMTEEPSIVIQRGLGGPVVTRISTEGAIWPEALNADGSRLLVSFQTDSYSPAWKTFDTATGTMIAEFEQKLGDNQFLKLQVVDPVAWKHYRLIPDGIDPIYQNYPTGPAHLVVTDLSTGDEIGTVRLPDILIGSTVEDIGSDLYSTFLVVHYTMPGLALSPDGSEIAAVSATDDGITLVDTKSLTVKPTLTMHEKAGLIDRLFAVLPLVPQTASAKASEGEVRIASYAADGRHLYVSGSESDFEPEAQISRGEGLRLVDLADGTIEAHLLNGVAVDYVVESADGSIYVVGFDYRRNDGQGPYSFLVARLEANADKVLAERTIADTLGLIIAPYSVTWI